MTVVLYATLSRYHPAGKGTEPFTVSLPRGATVNSLLKELGIGRNEAKQVYIAHRSCPGDYRLQHGQRIAVFPPIAGG